MSESETDIHEEEPDFKKGGGFAVQSVPSKFSRRRARATEVILSDRIELIASANQFVALMIDKQQGSGDTSEFRAPVELEASEQQAYNAALTFLRNQFKRGATETEHFVKLHETAEETEHTLFETE